MELWNNKSLGVKTLEFAEALKNQIISVAENSLEDLKIADKTKKRQENNKKTKIDNLFPHQINSIESWKKNNCLGIFEHATGSGKTVTALKIINEYISSGYPSLIVVPSKLLLNQWVSEINKEIPDAICVLAGAGNISWKKNDKIRNFLYGITPDDKRIVISTMQTASSVGFLYQLKGIEQDILLVADECHQVGSPQHSEILKINSLKRLGLSATPNRYGDPFGTEKILSYFGGILEPKVSLYDAIKSERLVEYEYFPKIINLTANEAEEWRVISTEIKREIARASSGQENLTLSNRAKMLLIERSRISKKSKTKINLAIDIVAKNYIEGETWLIYCEDQEQLREVSAGLRGREFRPLEYFSSMDGSSSETLKIFQMQGGILVSIRCLDEGVDIPSISHALILASSQNPRQFIQRRGRVLRK